MDNGVEIKIHADEYVFPLTIEEKDEISKGGKRKRRKTKSKTKIRKTKKSNKQFRKTKSKSR